MKITFLYRIACLTAVLFSSQAAFAQEVPENTENEAPITQTSDVPSDEVMALKKEVEEGEQVLAETQAEIESLKNQLMNSQEERKKYDEEVKTLMEQLEKTQ